MIKTWMSSGPRRRVVEDPETLGYRLVANPLLKVMDAEGWYALERSAINLSPGVPASDS
jgi:hypothetical protein